MATENTSMSIDELFDGGGKPSSAPAAEPAPAPEPAAETRDDGRDGRGRFAAAVKAADEAAAPTVTAQTTEPAATTDAEADKAGIPPWRVREITEERDRFRAEAEARAEENRQFRARETARANREREAQRRQQIPDPYNDPQGYAEFFQEDTRSVAQQIRDEVRDLRIEDTFGEMHEQSPEDFPKAYQALLRIKNSGDPNFERIRNAPNPGKALMRWYRDGETMREIGGDFAGWRKKERERLMSDPEFRKEAAAAWATEANGGTDRTGGGDTVVMMPSLNRATGSRGSPAQGGMRSTEEFTGLFNGNGRKRPA